MVLLASILAARRYFVFLRGIARRADWVVTRFPPLRNGGQRNGGQCANLDKPQQHRGQVLHFNIYPARCAHGERFSAAAPRARLAGWHSATRRRARAVPSGRRWPCSRFCRVCGLMPMMAANRVWLRPSFSRMTRASGHCGFEERAAFLVTRRNSRKRHHCGACTNSTISPFGGWVWKCANTSPAVPRW